MTYQFDAFNFSINKIVAILDSQKPYFWSRASIKKRLAFDSLTVLRIIQDFESLRRADFNDSKFDWYTEDGSVYSEAYCPLTYEDYAIERVLSYFE